MRYTLVVFALDGTFLDTLDDLTFSVNAALEKFSLPERTREEVRAFVGDGIAVLMRRAAGKEVPFAEQLLETFREEYSLHCQDKTRPYPQIMQTLLRLKEAGVRLAVVSNKADFATKKLVREYFGEFIGIAVGENERAGVRKKPAPDSLLSVMGALGVEKKDTVYVGDSEVDIRTAQAAGVDCISVTWGFKDEEFLKKNGATRLISDPLELLE